MSFGSIFVISNLTKCCIAVLNSANFVSYPLNFKKHVVHALNINEMIAALQ